MVRLSTRRVDDLRFVCHGRITGFCFRFLTRMRGLDMKMRRIRKRGALGLSSAISTRNINAQYYQRLLMSQHKELVKQEMLDDMRKRKIDMADEIFVINVGGYIGSSIRSEIAYAAEKGKVIRYLERNGSGTVD